MTMLLGHLAFKLAHDKNADATQGIPRTAGASPTSGHMATPAPGSGASPSAALSAGEGVASEVQPSWLHSNVVAPLKGVGGNIAAAAQGGTPIRSLAGMGLRGLWGGARGLGKGLFGVSTLPARAAWSNGGALIMDTYRGGGNPLKGMRDTARALNQQSIGSMAPGASPAAPPSAAGTVGTGVSLWTNPDFVHPIARQIVGTMDLAKADPDWGVPRGSFFHGAMAFPETGGGAPATAKLNARQPGDSFTQRVEPSGRTFMVHKPTGQSFFPNQDAFAGRELQALPAGMTPAQVGSANRAFIQDQHPQTVGRVGGAANVRQQIIRDLFQQRPDTFAQMFGDPVYLAQQANGVTPTGASRVANEQAISAAMQREGFRPQ